MFSYHQAFLEEPEAGVLYVSLGNWVPLGMAALKYF